MLADYRTSFTSSLIPSNKISAIYKNSRKLSPRFRDNRYVNTFRSLNKGLSLLETLIGVALLAIVASISIPSATGIISSHYLYRERDFLVRTLEKAHLISINRETKATLELKHDRYELKLNSKLITSHLIHSNYKIIKPMAPHSISFYHSGTTSPETIILRGNSASCIISLSLRGRITSSCS